MPGNRVPGLSPEPDGVPLRLVPGGLPEDLGVCRRQREAAVFGGIGIIPGALIGAYFIGGVETLVSALGYSLYRDGVVFAILIIMLIVKPTGLLGKNVREKV